MYNDWQNQINIELRTLRREEAREQMSTEDRLLRAGRLEQPAVSIQSLSGTRLQHYWLALSRILAGWWRTRRASLGALFPAVSAGGGRDTGVDSR